MENNRSYYGFREWKDLYGPFNSFPTNEIIVESSHPFLYLDSLFSSAHNGAKYIKNVPFSAIPLNTFCRLTFGNSLLTPENVIATKILYKKDFLGNIFSYLNVKIDNSTDLYFYIYNYNNKTNFGLVNVRLTIPEDLTKN